MPSSSWRATQLQWPVLELVLLNSRPSWPDSLPFTMLKKRTTMLVELVSLRISAELGPVRVEVRSFGPGGHWAGATPSMMRFERLKTSVEPTHTPRTWMSVGLALVPFGAAFTAACRLLNVLPPVVTVHVPVANWPQMPHSGPLDCILNTHIPSPSHCSTVHTLLSVSHVVPTGLKPFGGQVGPLPGQFSATSHCPAAGRHTWAERAKPSAGHWAVVPVQSSATSHTPFAGRHSVPPGRKVSGGQLGPL